MKWFISTPVYIAKAFPTRAGFTVRCTCMIRPFGALFKLVGYLRTPSSSPLQRHLSNRERKEQAKAARKERRLEGRTKKGEEQEEHQFIGAMAI